MRLRNAEVHNTEHVYFAENKVGDIDVGRNTNYYIEFDGLLVYLKHNGP